MRPSQKNIIDPFLSYDKEEIRDIIFSENYLYSRLEDEKSTNEFLASVGLIDNKKDCPSCKTPMNYVKSAKDIDKYNWKCICNKKISIRSSSHFSGSRLKLSTIIKILYKVADGNEILNISNNLMVNRKVVSGWVRLFREASAEYIIDNNEMLGGIDEDGKPITVEIDESLFFRRKYNRGRIIDGTWYVAGIERGSSKCFIIPTIRRNKVAMKEIIDSHILPGTNIVTDEWKAYKAAIKELNIENGIIFSHDRINHTYFFVDPRDPRIHTQTIEGFFSRSKYYLRKKNGINKNEQYLYLLEFLWIQKVKKGKRFNEI